MNLTQWLESKGINPDEIEVQDVSGISEEEAFKNKPKNGGVVILPLSAGGQIPKAWIEASK